MAEIYYSKQGYPLLLGLPVDICVFTVAERPHADAVRTSQGLPGRDLELLLIQRRGDPYINQWALPGGFTEIEEETLEQAAVRELKEETNLDAKIAAKAQGQANGFVIEQVKAYFSPTRDPRGYIPSVVFAALVAEGLLAGLKSGDDAKAAERFRVEEMPDGRLTLISRNTGAVIQEDNLAFDHAQIIHDALTFIRHRTLTTTVAKALLPEPFTLVELHQVIAAVVPDFADLFTFEQQMHNVVDVILEEVRKTDVDGAGEWSANSTKLYRFREDFVPKVSIYPGV